MGDSAAGTRPSGSWAKRRAPGGRWSGRSYQTVLGRPTWNVPFTSVIFCAIVTVRAAEVGTLAGADRGRLDHRRLPSASRSAVAGQRSTSVTRDCVQFVGLEDLDLLALHVPGLRSAATFLLKMPWSMAK